MSSERPPESIAQWQAFLASVASAYTQSDEGTYLMERSLAISSREMRVLHDHLTAERDALRETTRSLQETTRRCELALDAGGLGSWDWDLVSGVVRFDSRFLALHGLSERDESIQADQWLQRLHPDDVLSARAAVDSHLAGHAAVYEHEHRVRHSDGAWRWIHDRGMVVARSPEGAAIRMVGTHADVTERREADMQRAQSLKLESIGQLASGIAHEINTPVQYVSDNVRFLQEQFSAALAFLQMYASQACAPPVQPAAPAAPQSLFANFESLDFGFMSTEVPLAIRQSLDGLDRVSTIVRAMKDFAHPGSDQKSSSDLNKGICATVEVCRNRWKGVARVVLDLDPNLPLVPCFLSEFNQVILNLVVNAADAIGDATGEHRPAQGLIRIRTYRDECSAVVEVADNGPGIPEGLRAKVFCPFFTTKPVGGGTGQGLAICHQTIAVKHRGQLTFKSEYPGGTTFTIRLPLAESATEPRSNEKAA